MLRSQIKSIVYTKLRHLLILVLCLTLNSPNAFARTMPQDKPVDRAELNKRCAQLLDELEESEKLIDLYDQRLREAKKEIANLRLADASSAGEKIELEGKIKNLERIVEDTTAQRDIERGRVSDLKLELDRVRTERDRLRKTNFVKLAVVFVVGALIGVFAAKD